MKKTFKYILASVVLAAATLSFGPTVLGQTRNALMKAARDAVDGAVQYSKRVTPEPDENGVYTISLEAYVTGSVTVSTNYYPADVFLLLDFSGSMTGSGSSGSAANMPAMQNAVTTFIQTIQEKNQDVLEDSNGGYRVAIIPYSNSTYSNQNGCNVLYDVDDFTATPQGAATGGTLTYGGSSVWPNTGGGTRSGDAMLLAKELISDEVDAGSYTDRDGKENSKRSKIVILFTDGVPGSQGASATNWANNYPNGGNEMTAEASECINSSSNIINDYGGVVYTVGLFATSVTNYPARLSVVKTYMAYASSDFPNKTEMPSSSSDLLESTYSGKYSIVVDNAGDLAGIFASISNSVGGDYSASSASSVLVDVVATSFSVSTDADLGKAKVYQVACTQASASTIISFSDTKEEITDDVELVVDEETGIVSVTGFDYGANWCGWDGSANNNTGAPHGYKLVLEIPITVNDDAVGGPAVDTNADGSQLIIRDSEGHDIQTYDFISPVLKIPVNIWIQKTGLVEDDSAVFTLRRTPFVGSDVDYSTATYDKSWGTKVVVNKETMGDNGLVKVSGLDPNYIYKIEEDAWGSFGYTYQDGGIQYTIGDNVQNPFKFKNIPRNNVFDEAVVRNVFKERIATK